MLIHQVPSLSSLIKGVYAPKGFFLHAALLGQASAHCPIFPTAASRRSLDRVSVPVWLVILSDQLSVIALVSRYLTNKLILYSPILWPKKISLKNLSSQGVWGINHRFQWLSPSKGHVSYTLLTRAPLDSTPEGVCFRSTCMC